MKQRICFSVIVLSTFFPIHAHALNCDSTRQVARRVTILWNGLANRLNFDKELSESVTALKGNTDLLIGALGQGSKLIGKEGILRAKATPNGLLTISKQIQDDYAAYLVNGGKPADYEVTFVVSNHGVASEGPNPKYGIVGDGPDIMEPELAQFASSLPRGTRFKGIFSQCYGSDTLKTLMDHLPSESCACGTAEAAQKSPSFFFGDSSNSEFTSTVLKDAVRETGSLSTGTNLAFKDQFGINSDGKANNGVMLSSEMYLSGVLEKHFGAKSYGELEADAATYLDHLRREGTAPDSWSFFRLRSNFDRIRTCAEILGYSSIFSPKFIQFLVQIRAHGSARWESEDGKKFDQEQQNLYKRIMSNNKKMDQYNKSLKTLNNSSAEMSQKLSEIRTEQEEIRKLSALLKDRDNNWLKAPKEIAVAKLLARSDLEDIFTRISTKQEKEHLLQLKNCEQQSMAKNHSSTQTNSVVDRSTKNLHEGSGAQGSLQHKTSAGQAK